MQAVSFWNPSIISHFQLPFFWFQEGWFSPGCAYCLLECCYSLLFCSLTMCFFLLHLPKTIAIHHLSFSTLSVFILNAHIWAILDVSFHQSPKYHDGISKQVPFNFLLAQGLQKVFCKYPEVLPLAFYKSHTKNVLLW